MTRRSKTTRTAALLLLVGSMLVGCRTARRVAAQYPRSDIDAIYASSLSNPARNPVVLVHGFGGATLRRKTDDATVWGAFFTNDSLPPSREPGLRAFALDIAALQPPLDTGDLVGIEDDTRAVELLEKARAEPGVVDINISIYADLVELMERSGYGTCQSEPAAIEGLDRPPCLAFFYDWRQDNVGNAIRLGRFLEAARARIAELRAEAGEGADESVRFDLIAHSMGGLIARYFLRYGARDVLGEQEPAIAWAGAEYLDRLIVISTPNFGSMKVLREMIAGRYYPMIKFEPAMIFTWVSSYQMLPRAHHDLWLDREGHPIHLDVLSTPLWEENGWGPFDSGQDRFLPWIFPDETTSAGRRDRVAAFTTAAFERARRFQQVMDRRPDQECPTELTLFASDVQRTMARAVLVEKDGRKVLLFEDVDKLELKSPGDGSVTRASAVGDERLIRASEGYVTSPIPWDRQIFLTDMHRTFLGNPNLQNNLLHILLETPPVRAAHEQ